MKNKSFIRSLVFIFFICNNKIIFSIGSNEVVNGLNSLKLDEDIQETLNKEINSDFPASKKVEKLFEQQEKLDMKNSNQKATHKLIKIHNEDLNQNPHFSHHRGVDIAKEKALWEELFGMNDLKKPLKSVKSKGSFGVISDKKQMSIGNTTKSLVESSPVTDSSQTSSLSVQNTSSAKANDSFDIQLFESNIALEDDPEHSHHMGLDVQKESQFLFEKSIRDEILSGLVNKSGNSINKTRHLTSKHIFPQDILEIFKDENILDQIELNNSSQVENLKSTLEDEESLSIDTNQETETVEINLPETTRKIISPPDCVFPFFYKKKKFMACTTEDRGEDPDKPWCSLTKDFDIDQKWKICAKYIRTVGGNSNGDICHFPFKYEGETHNSCIDKVHRAEDNSTTLVKICSTTENYDNDKKWGYCLDYSMCHFPFIYKGKLYERCITNDLSSSFCATSFNFDIDKEWTHCPTVCEKLPKTDKNFAKFYIENVKYPCTIRSHFHRFTGVKLFDYVQPPCQLEYYCQNGYINEFNKIECRLDGFYDNEALCSEIFNNSTSEKVSGTLDMNL